MDHAGAPELSVIVPAGHESALPGCLRALSRQTLSPGGCEVLLVGGEPGAADALPLACSLRRIAAPRDLSPAGARNLGVQTAAGEYVLFLEPGCLPAPDCLRVHLETLRALPGEEYGVLGRLDPPAGSAWAALLAAAGLGGLGRRPKSGAPCSPLALPAVVNWSLPRRSIVAAGLFDPRFAGPDGLVAGRELALRLEGAGVGIVSVREGAASLGRLPDLAAVLEAAWARGRDEAALRARHPGAFAGQATPQPADAAFWSEPPARLVRAVEALAGRLEGWLAAADQPGAAWPEAASLSAGLSDLAGRRTRDLLAVIQPLLDAPDAVFGRENALAALLLLDACQACRGAFAKEAGEDAARPEAAGQRPRGRVLVATNYFWPSVGGTELLVEELGARLGEAGFAVEIACRRDDSRTAPSRRGMAIHAFDCTGVLDAVGGPGAEAYLRLIMTGGFDAVIVLSHPPVWCCSLLRALPRQGRPRLIMMASMNADDLAGWEARGEMASVAAILRAADVQVTVSEHGVDARVLDALGLPRVFLPHAVTDEAAAVSFRERLGLARETPLLACVGNFWPVKNQLGLLRAMADTPGDWRLLLAGAPAPWPDKRPYFMDCWAACARDPRLRILGPLPPAEAAALICEADALLVPSLGESAGPLVLLQAMAMGRPWIATPECNAVHDEAGGLIVPVARFPEAVAALAADPALARSLGELGREHWRRCFTWERSLEGFIGLIEGRDPAGAVPDLRLPDDLRHRWRQAARALFPEAAIAAPPRPSSQPRTNDHGEIPMTESTAAPVSDKAFRFSVVTPAYNAAPWIGQMLASFEQQDMGFDDVVEVIVVDDGSTDDTAEVVRRFAARHPGNVILVQKDNGGPASAKNLGLARVRGEWVTFVDADDFVAPDYFRTVDTFLRESGFDGNMVACNSLLFIDGENYVVDGHPLAYKFKATRVVDLMAEPDYIHLFTNTCFIRRTTLEATGVRNDERIKPTFDDAHFLNLVLLESGDCRIAFLKEARYLYRRRGAASGLAEGGWSRPDKYRDQVLFGYVDLLRRAKRRLGQAPAFVQNLVIYEARWYLQRLFKGTFPAVLSEAEQTAFFGCMGLAFALIDTRQVLLSTLPALDLPSRVAMLRAFKNERFTAMPFVLAEVAPGGAEARLVHWATHAVDYALESDAGPVPIPFHKEVVHRVGEAVLCHERHLWVPLAGGRPCRPVVDGQRPGVFCRGEMLDVLDKASVGRAFYRPVEALAPEQQAFLAAGDTPETEAFRGGWVLMDRIHTADDSAEHLCRWLRREHPEVPVRFVLDARAADWTRLSREGFPLLAYGSPGHHAALSAAGWLVSTHVDTEVIDPLRTREACGRPAYKVAFLQHGIIMNDLSPWLNPIPLDMMVASTRPEYASLVGGLYKFTEREIVLSGLPRHDALLARAAKRKPGRVVLFCPTWRQHLRRTAAHIPGLGEAEARLFRQSDFFKAWNALTGSRSLARLARDGGCKLLFLPHPEMTRFLPLFARSEAFTFLDWGELPSVQAILASCAAAVSDYSSLPFDVAYLGRPVAYYHFPETPDVYTSKNWGAGYFDYHTQGLGPVLGDPGAVEAWLAERLADGFRRQPRYDERADAFFTLRDGRNCRRVYEGIMARSR